jgi:hypothetical protein
MWHYIIEPVEDCFGDDAASAKSRDFSARAHLEKMLTDMRRDGFWVDISINLLPIYCMYYCSYYKVLNQALRARESTVVGL